jgi:hypothetical protein
MRIKGLTLAIALLWLSIPATAGAEDLRIPGGTITLYAGCNGSVRVGIDAIIGKLSCRGGVLEITVMGGGILPCAPDPKANHAEGDIPQLVQLKTASGARICLRPGFPGDREAFTVGLADSSLIFTARVKEVADTMVLVATAASFRPERR